MQESCIVVPCFHSQHLGSGSWFVAFLCILLFIICPNCACVYLFLVPYSFFVFCHSRRHLFRCKCKLSVESSRSSPPPEKAMEPHSSTLAWKIPWTEEPAGLQSVGSRRVGHDRATSLSLFTFHFHALEREMATHSSVLAWRIPWTEKPGRLQSMGSHRVGHD